MGHVAAKRLIQLHQVLVYIDSYEYGSQDHGNMIFSGTVIAKAGDEHPEMPTGEEAVNIAKQMTELRPRAIKTTFKAFRLKPLVESNRKS